MLAASNASPQLPQISEEEAGRFEAAFKDPHFKSLFKDYLDEIADPNNRKLYEEEISAMERERGNKIRFVKPEGRFVVKTSWASESGKSSSATQLDAQKVFVNIASSPELDLPTWKTQQQGKKAGQVWQLPHTVTIERVDTDNAGKTCAVFDVVYHPQCFNIASTQPRFRSLLIDSGLESLENRFSIQLSRDYRVLNLKYKGTPPQTAIRDPLHQSSTHDKLQTDEDNNSTSNIYFLNNLLQKSQSSYITSDLKQQKLTMTRKPIVSKDPHIITSLTEVNTQSVPTVQKPQYTIVHRNDIRIDNYTGERQKLDTSRPDSLILKIQLPLTVSVSEIDVKTQCQCVVLSVPDKYFATIDLPFPVIEENGTAKYDKTRKVLELVLPVVKAPHVPTIVVADETNNAESDSDTFDVESKHDVYSNTVELDEQATTMMVSPVKPDTASELTNISVCTLSTPDIEPRDVAKLSDIINDAVYADTSAGNQLVEETRCSQQEEKHMIPPTILNTIESCSDVIPHQELKPHKPAHQELNRIMTSVVGLQLENELMFELDD